jgi:transposase
MTRKPEQRGGSSAKARRLKTEAVAEALDLLRQNRGRREVVLLLQEKHAVSERTAYDWVNEALELRARHYASDQRGLRATAAVSYEAIEQKLLQLAQKALDSNDLRAAIDAYKGAADVRERWVRVLHLDRISPMLGLDAAVIRRQLVEALRNNLELLTDEQREELRQELADLAEQESASGDEASEDWRQLAM